MNRESVTRLVSPITVRCTARDCGGGDQDGIFALDAEAVIDFFLHCAHWIIIIAMIGDVNDISSMISDHLQSHTPIAKFKIK